MTVVRGRAEEVLGKLPPVHVVTARAVAPLDRLAGWGVPLLRPYGEMLALKGDTAEEEIKARGAALSKLGAVETSVLQVGEGVVDPLSTVVRVEVGESPGGVRFAAKRAKAARAGGRDGVAERRADVGDPDCVPVTRDRLALMLHASTVCSCRSVAGVRRCAALCIVFHVKRRSLLHGIISRGRAAAEPRDRKPLGSLGEGAELSTEVDFSTEEQASLVHDPEEHGRLCSLRA